MKLIFKKKLFSFSLATSLANSKGVLTKRKGWLINIIGENGAIGWGEVSPLTKNEFIACEKIIIKIGNTIQKKALEDSIHILPKCIAFGIGGALAEIDKLVGENSNERWMKPRNHAYLINPKGPVLEEVSSLTRKFISNDEILTLKIKVGLINNTDEQNLVQKIIKLLPVESKLRIDVNGGWDFEQAKIWVNILKQEPRIEWIEQPLPAKDIEGLLELSRIIPIALDESIIENPALMKSWESWQIRRPLLEGDPRILLTELKEGKKFRSISTTFETGIGKRWINHLAALQQLGPTPTAPGLAPGWSPTSKLFSSNPKEVWEAI